jgi:glycosyltransferase involved in cell wall biosynthesis
MVSSPPWFSVCVPNYNYARYIGATIQSVLDQTYALYEIVIVDNASTDGSVEVITPYLRDNVRLVRNPYNIGFAPNLDRAARQARHPYIIVLSADDLMRPTALEEYAHVIEALDESAANTLLASNIEYFEDSGRVTHRTSMQELFGVTPNAELTALNGRAAVFEGPGVFAQVWPRMKVATPFCATAYSRALYDRVGGYSSVHHTAPDANFAYKAMLAGAQVAFIDRPLFGYRVHGSNQVSSDRRMRTLKIPIDHYVFTLQFSDAELKRAGVGREQAVRALIDETCLNAALLEVKDGDSRHAFRLLMFGLATYPATVFRNMKTYLLAVLLLATPVLGRPISRWLHALRNHQTAAP